MKRLTSLGLCAIMAPAISLGVGPAFAEQHGAKPRDAQTQPRATPAVPGNPQAQQRGASDTMKARGAAPGAPIVSRPANSILAKDLMGSPLMSRQDQNFGPINNLILDKDGQVLAVIVGVGGFLGIGERDVAIAWDSLERHVDKDGKMVFHVDMTDAALRAAPPYKND